MKEHLLRDVLVDGGLHGRLAGERDKLRGGRGAGSAMQAGGFAGRGVEILAAPLHAAPHDERGQHDIQQNQPAAQNAPSLLFQGDLLGDNPGKPEAHGEVLALIRGAVHLDLVGGEHLLFVGQRGQEVHQLLDAAGEAHVDADLAVFVAQRLDARIFHVRGYRCR